MCSYCFFVVYSLQGASATLPLCWRSAVKGVKVSTTPHLWFTPLTHSHWKQVLFIFQTASRIYDPLKKKKEGRKNIPLGHDSSLMCWKERQGKDAVRLHAYCIGKGGITATWPNAFQSLVTIKDGPQSLIVDKCTKKKKKKTGRRTDGRKDNT